MLAVRCAALHQEFVRVTVPVGVGLLRGVGFGWDGVLQVMAGWVKFGYE